MRTVNDVTTSYPAPLMENRARREIVSFTAEVQQVKGWQPVKVSVA
jgi:hypothetical protein